MGLPLVNPQQLELSFGGYSDTGLRDENQDAFVVREPTLNSEREMKGSVACIADGVSCSEHGQKASHTSVMQFIADYYATPESWSVQRSAVKVITALNTWLYEQGLQQTLKHNGLVTTFSTIVFKSNTAFVFHVGDSRVYLLRDGKLRQLTRDHQRTNAGKAAYLTRALGMDSKLEVDFQTLTIQTGDKFLLTTDGVHDFVSLPQLQQLLLTETSFEACTEAITQLAVLNGSKDNVTSLIVGVKSVPELSLHEFQQQMLNQIIPPPLKVNNRIDQYTVTKVLHAGTRSHVYQVVEDDSNRELILKAPSLSHSEDKEMLLDMSNEYWVGTHVNNKRIMRIFPRPQPSPYLYLLCERVEGVTLRQWMYDNPNPDFDRVRRIVEELVKAVRVLQRLDMVHRDLKPENVMISAEGSVKLIDLGAVSVKALDEMSSFRDAGMPKGAVNYIAPEYLNGELATTSSDLFSVAVMTYEMLSGELPYTEFTATTLDKARHQKWCYQPLKLKREDIPTWLDLALKKGCHPNPKYRYRVLSEFVADISKPNQSLLKEHVSSPLIEKNPVLFWKGATMFFVLVAIVELIALIS
ncbi:bifunctional protein-serine/threonine kinase/phosphatase [Vibrio hangzhouensis]|uniref:Protein phosphatase n=1 Tax=Vibrio hangzhouensis TaxID=462991 RepID=A0A1H5YVL6_9VIBR|nr:bifunctional protein-serine/threonine kinase/phosphatase [Vibrio hangzhouensis]SEG27455.1 protein phosphatase [Vibrio hangzhouensis]